MSAFSRSDWCKFFVLILAFVLVWLRRADVLLNAQFWAEDAVFWYKDAYEQGFLSSLITPRNGYFQSVSTIIVGATTFANPMYAPLISNIFGVLIRAIVIWFLFTDRFDFLNKTARFFIAAYLLCMPGLQEVQANITNAHWYLSLYVSMIIISREPNTKLWKVHDLFFVILSGLSGPFVIFIIVASIFKYLNEFKERINIKTFFSFYFRTPYLALVTCGFIQGITILLTFNNSRSAAPLGFSMDVISSIISSNIFLFTFAPWYIAKAGWYNAILAYSLSIFIILLIIFNYIKGNWQAKVFSTLPVLIIIFSMAKPQLTDSAPQLPSLIGGEGSRYFVNIHIAIFSLLITYIFHCLKKKNSKTLLKILSSALLLVMMYFNYYIPPLPDMNWKQGARLINEAKPGERISFKVAPPWLTLELIKR